MWYSSHSSSLKWLQPLSVGWVVTAFQPSCQIAARAEHRVELRRAASSGAAGVVEAVAHAHAVELALDVALDRLGRLDAEDVQDRRHEVDRVVVLVRGSRPAPSMPAGHEMMHGSQVPPLNS